MSTPIDLDHLARYTGGERTLNAEILKLFDDATKQTRGWMDKSDGEYMAMWTLKRGGHDALKVFAAYYAASNHKGQPTVILAHTVKGFGLGKGGEGQMVAHQQKKLDVEGLRAFRDRFALPVADEELAKLPFLKLPLVQQRRARHARQQALQMIGGGQAVGVFLRDHFSLLRDAHPPSE